MTIATRKTQTGVCKGITQTGQPCKRTFLVDSEFCQYHSQLPEYKERMRRMHTAGGRATAKPLRLSTTNTFKLRSLADAQKVAAKYIEDVMNGKLPATATVTANLPRMLKTYADLQEKIDIEKRLDKMEAVAAKQQKK